MEDENMSQEIPVPTLVSVSHVGPSSTMASETGPIVATVIELSQPDVPSQFDEVIVSEEELQNLGGGEETETAGESISESDGGNQKDNELPCGSSQTARGSEQKDADGKGKPKRKPSARKALPWENIDPNDVKYKFEEDLKARTNLAFLRGNHLKDLAIQYERRTGANVFLKVQYFGKRKEAYNYCHGRDFLLQGNNEEAEEYNVCIHEPRSSEINDEGVKMIQATITEAVKQLPRSSSAPNSEINETDDRFQSPLTRTSTVIPRRQRVSSGSGCFRCGGTFDYIEVSGMKFSAPFFVCSAASCPVKNHNDCLGFPGVCYDDIKGLAPWFCDVHKGGNRPAMQPLLPPPPPPGATTSGFVGAATRASKKGNAAGDGEGGSAKRGSARGRGSRGGRGRPPKQ